MTLQKLLNEIERLNTYFDVGIHKAKKQGIKETVVAVDKWLPKEVQLSIEWQQIKEALSL